MSVFVIILGLTVLITAVVVLPGACILMALRREPVVV